MTTLRVRLLGKLDVSLDGNKTVRIEARKAQELLGYLLVHRRKVHAREILADSIWGDIYNDRSKKYLRHALWQLQTAMISANGAGQIPLFLLDSDWVQINPQANLWLDIAEFESAFQSAQGMPGGKLDNQAFQALEGAVELYQGDLLEGCYEDWCLFERERLQNIFMAILDKLMDSCMFHREYEHGIAFGERILRVDIAQEHAHRKLIRLYALSGKRTEALRQFERCQQALKEALSVEPARETIDLYQQIRNDQVIDGPLVIDDVGSAATIQMLLMRLNQLSQSLAHVQHELSAQIEQAESFLLRKR